MSADVMPVDYIEHLYNVVLRRESDPAGHAYYSTTHYSTNIDPVRLIVHSEEAVSNVDPIIQLYQIAFGRIPDQDGLTHWTNILRNGTESISQIADDFAHSDEFSQHYADVGGNIDRFVTDIYHNALDRDPDAAGLYYWTHSGLTNAQIMAGISEAPEFLARSHYAVDAFLYEIVVGLAQPGASLLPNHFIAPADPSTHLNAPTIDLNPADYFRQQPTIQGHGDPGSTVTLVADDQQVLGSVLVRSDGSWLYQSYDSLSEGYHTIAATESNGLGNFSPTTSTTYYAHFDFGAHVTDVSVSNQISPGFVSVFMQDNRAIFTGAGTYNGTIHISFDQDLSIHGFATIDTPNIHAAVVGDHLDVTFTNFVNLNEHYSLSF